MLTWRRSIPKYWLRLLTLLVNSEFDYEHLNTQNTTHRYLLEGPKWCEVCSIGWMSSSSGYEYWYLWALCLSFFKMLTEIWSKSACASCPFATSTSGFFSRTFSSSSGYEADVLSEAEITAIKNDLFANNIKQIVASLQKYTPFLFYSDNYRKWLNLNAQWVGTW